MAYVKYPMTECECATLESGKEEADGGENGYSSIAANGVDNDDYQLKDHESSNSVNKEAKLGGLEYKWCYTSDSHVTFSNETEVHESQAYLLLYVQR